MQFLDGVILEQPPNVRLAYLEVLNWVLHADGVIDAREVRFLDEAARQLGVTEVRDLLPERPMWSAAWSHQLQPVSTWVLMQAALIAWADGVLHHREVEVLQTIQSAFDIPEEVLDHVLAWAERGQQWSVVGQQLLARRGEWTAPTRDDDAHVAFDEDAGDPDTWDPRLDKTLDGMLDEG